MLALKKLLTPDATQAATEGTWQLVRLRLDPATGEQINVGVVFRAHGETQPVTRFVRDVSGLRCLYNHDLAEDAAFLIDQAEHAIESGLILPSGWNIALSDPLTIRGPDAESMVNDLFARLIPLGAKESDTERLDTDDHAHATRSVRKTVRQLLTKHLQIKSTPDFWRSKPVETLQNGRTVKLDVQVEATVGRSRLHGTIASAWYKTQYHRSAYLDRGATAMMTATQLYPSDNNIMYLLRPGQDQGFTLNEVNRINADIDSVRWLVEERGAKLAIFESERDMAHNILDDLGVI